MRWSRAEHREWLDSTVTDVSGMAIGRENFHLWGEVGVGANEVLGRGVSILAPASGKSATQDLGKNYGWKGNAGFRLSLLRSNWTRAMGGRPAQKPLISNAERTSAIGFSDQKLPFRTPQQIKHG